MEQEIPQTLSRVRKSLITSIRLEEHRKTPVSINETNYNKYQGRENLPSSEDWIEQSNTRNMKMFFQYTTCQLITREVKWY